MPQLDFMAQEPTIEVPRRIKESLRRMYKLASLPAEEAMAFKAETQPTTFENVVGSLVGRIISLPFRGLKETGDMVGDIMRSARQSLAEPMGETGQWTPEQLEMAQKATMVAGAGIGSSVPGGAVGETSLGIARKDMLRGLAKGFKSLREKRPLDERVAALFGKKLESSGVKTPFVGETEKRTYRELIKATHHVPQKVLDPVEKVSIEALEGAWGKFRPVTKSVRFERALPEGKGPKVIGHEFLHSEQFAKVGLKTKIPDAVLEAQAYEFDKLFAKKIAELPKGQKLTPAMWEELEKESLRNMIEKHGTDFRSYTMKDVLGRR